jgi:hypothetical protein
MTIEEAQALTPGERVHLIDGRVAEVESQDLTNQAIVFRFLDDTRGTIKWRNMTSEYIMVVPGTTPLSPQYIDNPLPVSPAGLGLV